MSIFLILVALILLLAGPTWFSGAATVGTILLIAGGIWFVIEACMFLFVGNKIRKF